MAGNFWKSSSIMNSSCHHSNGVIMPKIWLIRCPLFLECRVIMNGLEEYELSSCWLDPINARIGKAQIQAVDLTIVQSGCFAYLYNNRLFFNLNFQNKNGFISVFLHFLFHLSCVFSPLLWLCTCVGDPSSLLSTELYSEPTLSGEFSLFHFFAPSILPWI